MLVSAAGAYYGLDVQTARMTDRFDDETLALLNDTGEVDVETRRPDGRERRTIIWVMVDGADVYLRSVRGVTGRWFRDLSADPHGALIAGDRRVPFRAVQATDGASIAACNRALQRKYEGIEGYDSMLEELTLETTLRLVPA